MQISTYGIFTLSLQNLRTFLWKINEIFSSFFLSLKVFHLQATSWIPIIGQWMDFRLPRSLAVRLYLCFQFFWGFFCFLNLFHQFCFNLSSWKVIAFFGENHLIKFKAPCFKSMITWKSLLPTGAICPCFACPFLQISKIRFVSYCFWFRFWRFFSWILSLYCPICSSKAKIRLQVSPVSQSNYEYFG